MLSEKGENSSRGTVMQDLLFRGKGVHVRLWIIRILTVYGWTYLLALSAGDTFAFVYDRLQKTLGIFSHVNSAHQTRVEAGATPITRLHIIKYSHILSPLKTHRRSRRKCRPDRPRCPVLSGRRRRRQIHRE